jgi:hypothetical protein
LSKPFASSVPNKVLQACSQTPSSSSCFSRRRQVDEDRNSSGNNRHAAPVCSTHRMPSK